MSESESFGVRISNSIKQRVERYAEQNSISRNKAIEELLSDGLKHKRASVEHKLFRTEIAVTISAFVVYFAAWFGASYQNTVIVGIGLILLFQANQSLGENGD